MKRISKLGTAPRIRQSNWHEAAAGQIQRWMDRVSLQERWPYPFIVARVQMTALYGPERALEESNRFIARLVLQLILVVLGVIGLGMTSGPPMLAGGLLLLPFVAWYSFQSLQSRVKQRKRQLVLELPELLNKLTLLLNAGETIHQAIHRCASPAIGTQLGITHPLYVEWAKLSRALQDNKPLPVAMEAFSRSCSVLEVSMLCTAVLMNYRRGGPDFVTSLQELSHTLWERRKAMAKTIGEEASSKLVLPMVLLFCTVMVIVAAPALLIMG